MKNNKLDEQSGVALIAVMVLIALSMFMLPQIMNLTSFASGRGVGQAVQIKNAAKAEEVNHLLQASLVPNNFNRIFPAGVAPADHVEEMACDASDPCMSRLMSASSCPFIRFEKRKWNNAGKTIFSFACRDGKSPTDAQRDISCEAFSALAATTQGSSSVVLSPKNLKVEAGQAVTAQQGLQVGTTVQSLVHSDSPSQTTLTLSLSADQTVSSRRISFEPNSAANLASTGSMRLYTCVFDEGTNGRNMAISVWSYLNIGTKYLKVQEDNY
jgi:hypothetical protein